MDRMSYKNVSEANVRTSSSKKRGGGDKLFENPFLFAYLSVYIEGKKPLRPMYIVLQVFLAGWGGYF